MKQSKLDDEQIAAEVASVLGAKVMSSDEILEALTAGGIELGAHPQDRLNAVFETNPGGRLLVTVDFDWAASEPVLLGRWFTHAVSVDELTHDVLTIDTDLIPAAGLFTHEGTRPIVGGGLISFVMTAGDEPIAVRNVPEDMFPLSAALALPVGTLAGLDVSVGDLIALRYTEDGWQVTTPPAGSPADPQPLITAIDDYFTGLPEITRPIGMDQIIWSMCLADPHLLRHPIPPLSTVLPEHFQQIGESLAPIDFDYDRWRDNNKIRSLQRDYDLDPEAAENTLALIKLVEVLGEVFETLQDSEALQGDQVDEELVEDSSEGTFGDSSGSGSTDLINELMPWLESTQIAEALFAETVECERTSPGALALLVQPAMAAATVAAEPNLWWLQGRVWERMCEPLKAKACFEQALDRDPQLIPALIQLARIESDRGQARAALQLLARAGDHADPHHVELLKNYIPQPRTDIGRNARCWCGSGRKYKQCHLHAETAPLVDRARWLYHKGLHFLENNYSELIYSLAVARAASDNSPTAYVEAAQDDLVLDTALFEGGVFEQFVLERGELLPDDERITAEQWLLHERSLFDVIAVTPGHSMTLRDVRTGDRRVVPERTASRQISKGTLICTRVLPVGETWLICGGGDPIDMSERDQLITLLDGDPEPVDIVELLTRRFPPPIIHTTEGELVTLCEATITSNKLIELTKAFDTEYELDDTDSEERTWVDTVEVDGLNRIRATLALKNQTVSVFSNSEPRFDRVLEFITSIDPDRVIADEQRQPIDFNNLPRDSSADETGAATALAQQVIDQDPELQEALAAMIRGYEDAWLDENIPALNGLTPRQAAADPTRREDVIRLLDSFPTTDQAPGGMDRERLRAALEL